MTIVSILWQVTRVSGEPLRGRITLDHEHVARMYPGPPPVDFAQYGAELDWRRAMEKADTLAKMIAAQIASDIVQACDPEFKR